MRFLRMTGVVDVEVVLDDPALGQFQVPAIVLLGANGDEDPGRLAILENGDDLIGLSFAEIGFDKFITPAFGGFQNRSDPFFSAVGHPALKLRSLITSIALEIDVTSFLGATRVEAMLLPNICTR